jgi:outer membrane receptor protein involved in Fe transport
LGLFDSLSGRIQSAVREDTVMQTQLGLHADSEVSWTPWLKTVTGLRLDQFDARVSSALQSQNSGTSAAALASPKLSMVLQPWESTELFLNMGRGFHSNDARGTTAHIDPRSLQPVSPVPGLVRSMGRELGMKSQLTQDWLMRLTWWRLDSDSELVYLGDAGTTVPGRAARREGLEWSQQVVWRRGVSMDASLAGTRPRYVDADPAGAYIPNAVNKVATLGLSLRQLGDWSGSWGVRYLGSAPLVEDNSLRSASSLTSYLRVTRALSAGTTLSVDCLNLTNRQNQDISYAYVSRLAGEPTIGVNGLHVHPAEPRTLRVTLQASL